jgi:hypothetical protein
MAAHALELAGLNKPAHCLGTRVRVRVRIRVRIRVRDYYHLIDDTII